MKLRVLLIILALTMMFFSCGKKKSTPTGPQTGPSTVDAYFPIVKGTRWVYRVDFPENVQLPYKPWFEYPSGILCITGICGMGSWDAGQIDFEVLVEDIYDTSSTSSTWEVSLSQLGLGFYFYRTDTAETQCQLRLTIQEGNANLDIIAVLPIGDPPWRIARALARLTPEDLTQQFDISVTAGEFKNCVKSMIVIHGDGMYVPSGQYPIETFLAPNVGIIKAVGKDRDENILYTLELAQFQQ